MKTIWSLGSKKQFKHVESFKNIFIEQKREKIYSLFDKDFGLHNGYHIHEYCNYEFEEFALKSNRFELTKDAQIECFDIGDNYVYFSLGKKNDKAVFESIFLWDDTSEKFKGNQYPLKIEPKIQFVKNNKTKNIIFNRRINFKGSTDNLVIKKVLIDQESHDFVFFKQDLEGIFGGTFYSLLYNDDNYCLDTYWNDIKVFTNEGVFKNKVLMRGTDHPLFLPQLFPQIISCHEFTIEDNIYPVVINIQFEDNSEEFIKYPLEKLFKFHKKIKYICLTDNLSFDWIINNI